MLPLAHIGITLTIVRAVEKRVELPGIDYRLLLGASLLPDILDKPLAYFLFDRSLHEGRAFGHSLAFLLLLGIFGLVWRFWRKGCVPVTILTGVIFHDLLDSMWLHAGILLWPLYGWAFPAATNEAWQGTFQIAGRNVHWLVALDAFGALLLLNFFFRLVSIDRLIHFLRTGECHS